MYLDINKSSYSKEKKNIEERKNELQDKIKKLSNELSTNPWYCIQRMNNQRRIHSFEKEIVLKYKTLNEVPTPTENDRKKCDRLIDELIKIINTNFQLSKNNNEEPEYHVTHIRSGYYNLEYNDRIYNINEYYDYLNNQFDLLNKIDENFNILRPYFIKKKEIDPEQYEELINKIESLRNNLKKFIGF